MPFQQISFQITAQEYETTHALLQDLGALAVSVGDAQDQPLYEPPPGSTPLWEINIITALFPEDIALLEIIRLLEKLNFTNIQREYIEDQAWERVCLDQFHPMQFGERLWICPSWRNVEKPDALIVKLDPGLAFGTGTHPTTRLCLEWLATHDLTGKTVIDYGCGSGILGISAKKLGAEKVYAIDNDPQALHATKENAEENALSLDVYLPEDFSAVKADVIVANILANPLLSLAPLFISYLKPEGKIVLSGILQEQVSAVKKAYEPFIFFEEIKIMEEWACMGGYRVDEKRFQQL